jgi:DNA-binding NarL/FixJ family response regulator
MPSRAIIRVLIADDHAPFTQAVQAILREDERLEVVGTAHDGAEAVELARTLQPDVVLMDISMPVLDGIAATRQIAEAAPGAQVLVLSGSSRSEDVDRARRAGARAYTTKDHLGGSLVEAIVTAAHG